MKQKFTVEVEQVNEPIRSAESNCNEIMFVNQSTTAILYVDKFPVQPGTRLVYGGNENEVCVKLFQLEGAGDGTAWIVRKIYV